MTDGTVVRVKKQSKAGIRGIASIHQGQGKEEKHLCQAVLGSLGDGGEDTVLEILRELAEQYVRGGVEKVHLKKEKEKRMKVEKEERAKSEKQASPKEPVAEGASPANLKRNGNGGSNADGAAIPPSQLHWGNSESD